MSKSHTPGPWFADKIEDRSAFNIFMPGYCSAGASVHHLSNATGCMGSREVEANARLIASAPELLDALRRIVALWDHHASAHGDGVASPLHKVARAAVAKATGGQP